MQTATPAPNPDPAPALIPGTFDLKPLLDYQADALPPDPENNIAKVSVRRMVFTWNTATHDTFIREADDILHSPASAELQSLTATHGVTLAKATLSFHFTDASEPVLADITPPSNAKVRVAKSVQRVLAYLCKRRLARPSAPSLPKCLLLLAVALFAADALSLDFDDSDDDDHKKPALATTV